MGGRVVDKESGDGIERKRDRTLILDEKMKSGETFNAIANFS